MMVKEQEILLTKVEREACEASFFDFFLSFWPVISAEKLDLNWHLKYLCDELQSLTYYIVNRLPNPGDEAFNIPPGTTKSTICTVMWPVWIWTQDASIRTITNSHSSGLSLEHATKSRDIIESDKFKRLFPEIRLRDDKGAKGFYGNTKGGSRYTTSTGSSAIGEHAHLIINDDPSDPKQVFSEALQAQVENKLKELSQRKVNKANTITVTIMQRLGEKDATGYLLANNPSLKHICLPAELSDKVKPAELKENYVDGLLDPIRLSRPVLDKAKQDLGSANYSGQFEQNPTVQGGNIIKENWFGRISFAEFKAISAGFTVHFFADTAMTKKKENDPTGIIATCKIGNLLYVSSGTKVRLKTPDLVRFIPNYVLGNGYSKASTIRIEPKANGLPTKDFLFEQTGLSVMDIKTDLLRVDKMTRLKTASPKVEAGRVILVDGAWVDEFVDEVCGFPGKTHDEYVDLLSYAVDWHFNNDEEISQQAYEQAAKLL